MRRLMLSLAAFAARWLPAPARRLLYRLGPLTRGLRRALNWSVPAGLLETTVQGGALVGARLVLDLQQEKDYWLGTYEPELQQAIKDWVQPGWVVYDVGANIGYISLSLARAVGEQGQVYAFEALPANVARLRQNVSLNAWAKVEVVQAAVTGAPGEVQFLVGPSGGMGKAAGSAGRELDYAAQIRVPAVVLDEYVYKKGNPAPQAIKLDIEGGEVLALPGMRRLLHEHRPLVFLELHGETAARVAWETLTSASYILRRMAPGYPPVERQAELDWKSYLVAIPEGRNG
jgi:FkbM family methyltransferase